MEDIGCHFKLEPLKGNLYHQGVNLSSGRNALRYILRINNIKKIYLPYFLCESLSDVSKKELVEIIYYHVDSNLLPNDNIKITSSDTYIYIVNYFGLLRDLLPDLVSRYHNVIIDNTHDFYNENNYNTLTIYNYRKYFGIPDGATIVGDIKKDTNILIGKSANKLDEMIKRDELGQYYHYKTFYDADKYYELEDLTYMSNFTYNYLKAIDYEDILNKRLNNYKYLQEHLQDYNEKHLEDNLTYMYPLYTNNGEDLRRYLQENNIYSQWHWPNIVDSNADIAEINLSKNIVCLPIDQRYDEEVMNHIANTVKNYYRTRKK